MNKILLAWNAFNLIDSDAFRDYHKVFGDVVTTSRIPELSIKLDFFNFVVDSHIPIIPANYSPTFADCCDRMAVKILKEAETRKVVLSWSGGIDSTSMVVAILKNGYNKIKHNIVVTCNMVSVDEYKWFFYNVVMPNFELLPYNSDGMHVNLIYSGDLGDQLFGSFMLLDIVPKYGEDFVTSPYKDSMLKYTRDLHGEIGARMIEPFFAIADYAPFQIKTVFDFVWWWNYSQKWQHVKHRHILWGTKDNLKHFDNHRTFFDSTDFEIWAMTRHNEKIVGGDLRSYKMIAKEYIVDYTKDENYYNKLKVSSISTKLNPVRTYMLDANFQPVYNYDDYINENRI